MSKIVIITNIPAPYRVPVYERIAQAPQVTLLVIFCCERETNRHWDLPVLRFDHVFLTRRMLTIHERYVHNNLDVLLHLHRFKPDVIVNDGLNPTNLYAFCYGLLYRIPHVPMTDGTDASERHLSKIHRGIRRLVYRRSEAVIAASLGGHRLYAHFGVPASRCFTSCLCVDNQAYAPSVTAPPHKVYDLMFCARLVAAKNPGFALRVAHAVAKRLRRRIHFLLVGSGELENTLRCEAECYRESVEVRFAGFASQGELPALYQSASIFLFPTLNDVWGVVANEACAAGLPVIVSPQAGAATELVVDGENGYVRTLEVDSWAQCAATLLSNPTLYERYSQASLARVARYTFEAAAQGIQSACQAARATVVRSQSSQRSLPESRLSTGLSASTAFPSCLPSPSIAASSVPQWREPEPEPMTDLTLLEQPESRPSAPQRVVIVERLLTHYRIAFYERLRTMLASRNIELQLLIGTGTPAEDKKKDTAELGWAVPISTLYFFGNRLCWQPFGRYCRSADLVIVLHENKLLYNLWLLFVRRPRRLAFWGHGCNLQSVHPHGLKERFKRWTINKVDWWFAYTDMTATLIDRAGFPRRSVTIVENAADTAALAAWCGQVDKGGCEALRAKLGLRAAPIGIFLGSLYHEKRLDFLIAAAILIRRRIPGFQLLIVGAGPQQPLVEALASREDWIRYAGPLKGRAKATALVLADVMLNPGLVGLGILDSFVSGTPMFTTDCGLHSPEIAYLKSGSNGVMTGDDVHLYAQAVADTLQQPEAMARLRHHALASAHRYSIENMCIRFSAGIVACLKKP